MDALSGIVVELTLVHERYRFNHGGEKSLPM
jgi:hypothetical protein